MSIITGIAFCFELVGMASQGVELQSGGNFFSI